jgi:translocation and assembly module TamB
MRRLTLVVVLALALIASLVWLAGSQSSLQWALGRVVQASHGRLHFEGVRGSLFGAVEIARTRFSSPELEVSVEKCSLHFSLLPLLLGQDLVIDRVAAESVMLRQTPSDEPIVTPTDLTLPLAIQLRSLEVRRLSVQWGESITPLSNVRAQLASDGKQHQITLHQVESPWATASASLQLRGVAPFALNGTARLTPVEGSRLPAANVTVGGTLLELKAGIRAQASWLSAVGSGHAQPFAPSPSQSFSAEIERLDLRSIDSSLPHAELKGSIRVHTDAEKHLAGELPTRRPVRSRRTSCRCAMPNPVSALITRNCISASSRCN